MNKKKFALASLAAFVFMAIYEMVVHSVLLRGIYDQTPQLWRGEAEMDMLLMMIGYALMSLVLVYVFTQKMNVRSIKGGAWAGVWLGLPLALAGAMSYVWMPISVGLAICWFIATFIKVVGIGKISGMIYKD